MRYLPRNPLPPTDEMRAAAEQLLPGNEHPAPHAPQPPSHPRTTRERLMAAAYGMRGVPYVWGAKGPDRFDCSGFTKAAYSAVGVALPDGSFNQAKGETPLSSTARLVPGDLLFYRWRGDAGVTHVTLYAGDGWAIGTGSPGQPRRVVVYPLTSDLRVAGTVITYRHIPLSDDADQAPN